ncbi:MAG: hypothetical protein JO095_20115 [Alphaproteobacteria bacterium]|nr:hypothetical protein [Alphaproteobacteria bacterium]
MRKAHLLASVCAVALMSATPVLAAGDTTSNTTGAPTNAYGGSSGTSATGAAGNGTAGSPSTNTNVHSMGSMSNESMGTSHHGRTHARHATSREDTSQNAEIDRLNEQSLQAAQQGRSMGASDWSGGNSTSTQTPSGGAR